jgi:hypothetical protein
VAARDRIPVRAQQYAAPERTQSDICTLAESPRSSGREEYANIGKAEEKPVAVSAVERPDRDRRRIGIGLLD